MPDRPTSVAEEIQQSKPWSSVAEEVTVSVVRTASLLRRALTAAIEAFHISPAQYNVLRILRGAGEAGLPTLTVRDRLLEEAPGITRLIDKLERAKLVRRDRTGKDRRTVKCVITPAGLALLAQADVAVRTTHERVAAAIPAVEDQRRLVELLALMRGGLGAAIGAAIGGADGGRPA